MAKAAEIAALVAIIGKAYPSFEADKDRVALFVDMLADLDPAALKAAVKQHIATSKFPPTIAELRQGAATVSGPALPSYADAWEEVLGEVRRVGYLGMPSFSHPLIAKAVAVMGWRDLCASEVSETATWRAQFRDIYNSYAARAAQEAAYMPSVRALADRNGALQALPKPVETRPALPAPIDRAATPRGMDSLQPLRFRDYVRAWRVQTAQERAADARAKAEGECDVPSVQR